MKVLHQVFGQSSQDIYMIGKFPIRDDQSELFELIMVLVNLSETPDLRFVEIVHTGIEDRDNLRHPEYFQIKLSQLT